MLKQGVRPARSRSQTNKFLGQNREAITEGNLPVTTTIAESYAFPAAHAARGRSASPRCSRRRTASGGACGISPFWRRSCVRTPWAPRRESRSVWFDNGVRSIETTYRVPPPGTGDVGAAGSRTFGCRSRSSSAGPWWGQLLFGLGRAVFGGLFQLLTGPSAFSGRHHCLFFPLLSELSLEFPMRNVEMTKRTENLCLSDHLQ
jgi:hypothetical protein